MLKLRSVYNEISTEKSFCHVCCLFNYRNFIDNWIWAKCFSGFRSREWVKWGVWNGFEINLKQIASYKFMSTMCAMCKLCIKCEGLEFQLRKLKWILCLLTTIKFIYFLRQIRHNINCLVHADGNWIYGIQYTNWHGILVTHAAISQTWNFFGIVTCRIWTIIMHHVAWIYSYFCLEPCLSTEFN